MPASASRHLQTYVKVWRDINRALWMAALEGASPRPLIYAELKRRVDHTRVLEKSGRIRFPSRHSPSLAIYRVCSWLAAGEANFAELIQAFGNILCAIRAVELDPHGIDIQFSMGSKRWIVLGCHARFVRALDFNFYYLRADERIWKAILRAIVKKHVPSRLMAERYVHTSQAQSVLAIYAQISPLRVHDVYDLSELFDNLNAIYFAGKVRKPLLAWHPRANYRTLGTYNFTWDILCVSRIFNDRRIPEVALRFILYHEMLHIVHGARHVDGRLIAHTPAFRRDERRFAEYDEAMKIIHSLRAIVEDTDAS